MRKKQIILDRTGIKNKINRIAFSIIEEYYNEKQITIIGFEKNGYIIAKKLQTVINNNHKIETTIHKIKMKNNNEYTISPKLNPDNVRNIFLVDDVLKSGKTIIYGIKKILNYPVENLKTIILINRNHNQFPIGVDYIGLNLSTTLKEHIQVILDKENECVYLS